VQCLDKTPSRRNAEAILNVIRDNRRNQERSAEAGLLRVCARVAITWTGRADKEKDGPYMDIAKLLQCIETDCENNWKKLGSVATAVEELADLAKRCWSKKGDETRWVPGGLEAGRLLLRYASKSKANETTVQSAFPSNRDWMAWLRGSEFASTQPGP